MITVAHIITALGSGGAERVLFQVASRPLPGAEIRQVVICLADEGHYGPQLRSAGVELHCLGMRRGRISPAAFLRLVGLLRRLRPDVIMTWLYHADLMGTLAGRLAGVRRIVWNIRCSDMDFSHYSPMTRWIVAVLVRLSRLPWAVATNSRAGQRAHERLGYRPRQWVYLPNGFDTEEWKPDAKERAEVRRELGFADGDVVIGMVARVDPQKDHATFLEAASLVAARYPQLRVLLVGRGTDRLEVPEGLRPVTRALGERRDVRRLMRALDCLVSSSAYGEGFPNVLGEAMATGVPCVATDVGDSAFIVGSGGRIVPPGQARALADSLCVLIDSPTEELQSLSCSVRDRIENEFSVDRCVARYVDLLRAVAAASSLNLLQTTNLEIRELSRKSAGR